MKSFGWSIPWANEEHTMVHGCTYLNRMGDPVSNHKVNPQEGDTEFIEIGGKEYCERFDGKNWIRMSGEED